MPGSFSAGLSGLTANSQYLTVIGNNLANINTVGYKASSVTFSDLVSQTVGGSSVNPMQLGLGVQTGSISPIFSQGSIESTKEPTNAAIQGNGFFVVRGASVGTAYTRAGAFTFDSDGKLVSPDGSFVQGYTTVDPLTGRMVTVGQPTDLQVPRGTLRPPVATTKFGTLGNLDSASLTGDTFTVPVQMYDGLGAAHIATITYTKAAAVGAWAYSITVPGVDVTGPGVGGAAVPPVVAKAGTFTFDPAGQLLTVDGAAPADVTVTTPAWFDGAAANVMTWDLIDANGVASVTGYASPSATAAKTQNGAEPGTVDNISITSDGTILATFGAGKTAAVGQLAIANFNNAKGLIKLGANNYGETQASGIANIGAAGTGGRGTVLGSALEQSNVDIAQEFTQMILAQRGYQAASKIITVSDEILVDTLQLKR